MHGAALRVEAPISLNGLGVPEKMEPAAQIVSDACTGCMQWAPPGGVSDVVIQHDCGAIAIEREAACDPIQRVVLTGGHSTPVDYYRRFSWCVSSPH